MAITADIGVTLRGRAMNDRPEPAAGKGSFFGQPEMLVAMAAIVLSICGLFIALYEASIARRADPTSS